MKNDQRQNPPSSKDEQIKELRKQRLEILEEIHEKQQQLDRVDFMLHELRKQQ